MCFHSHVPDSPTPENARPVNINNIVDHPRLTIRTPDANLRSTCSEFTANSPASAPVTVQASGQAAPVKARSLARTHLAQTTATLDTNCDSTSTTDTPRTDIFEVAIPMQEKNVEERAAAQTVAQLAPSLSSPRTADPDSHEGHQPHLHSDDAPYSRPVDHQPSCTISTASNIRNSGSLGQSADSAMEAQPWIETQTSKDSPRTQPDSMDTEQPADITLESQPQKLMLTDHIISATPPSSQDQSPKAHTPSPNILSQTEIPNSRDTSPEDKSTLSSQATTAPSSDRRPCPFEKLLQNNRYAKYIHLISAQTFTKTQETIRVKEPKLFLLASRGFERGPLPTKRTKPPLLKRRYSIDVNTKGWGTEGMEGWKQEDEFEAVPFNIQRHKSDHLNPPPVLGTSTYSPNPSRYIDFGERILMNPPENQEIYLELGNATIRNDAFLYVGVVDWSCGSEVWMRDESIDMAMETLNRDLECDAHGIAIASSTVAQICYFAFRLANGFTAEYDRYRAQFKDKNWIFLVINDAIGETTNIGQQGCHWSLVALDFVHKSAHYYDSLFIQDEAHVRMGQDIAIGMLQILGLDLCEWTSAREWNSPHQVRDNQFHGDKGPCGPFIFKMTEQLILRILQFQRSGIEHECKLELESGFRRSFYEKFNSLDVRRFIQSRIAHWKAVVESTQLVDAHDQQAIQDTDVTLVDEPVAVINMYTPGVLPVQQETSYSGRHSSRPRSRSLGCSNSDPPVDVDLSDYDDNETVIGNSSDSDTGNECRRVHNSPVQCNDYSDEPDTFMADADDNDQHGGVTLSVNDDNTVANEPDTGNTPCRWADEDDDGDEYLPVTRIS